MVMPGCRLPDRDIFFAPGYGHPGCSLFTQYINQSYSGNGALSVDVGIMVIGRGQGMTLRRL